MVINSLSRVITPAVSSRHGLSAFSREQELAGINNAVKTHEKTHLALLGPYAKAAPSYSYVTTGTGGRYAVGGSIPVDLSPVYGDPEATLRKARAVLAASLAPNSPSSADYAVAAKAYRLEMEAKQQIASEQAKDGNGIGVGEAEERNWPDGSRFINILI